MKIAIIPARGGSKRIPRKNIRPFHGKPIIEYSIETALKSNLFDKVIVSTDDDLISSSLQQFEVEVNDQRPKELSDDFATIRDVIRYEIERNKLTDDDEVCLLYSTAPLLSSANLIESHKALEEEHVEFVLSVCEYSPPIDRALQKDGNGYIRIIGESQVVSRTQDLSNSYFDAGQFCWGKVKSFVSSNEVLLANTKPYLLSQRDAIDIDTLDDWLFAEQLYKVRCGEK